MRGADGYVGGYDGRRLFDDARYGHGRVGADAFAVQGTVIRPFALPSAVGTGGLSIDGTMRADRHCVDDTIGCPATPNDRLRTATRRSHAAVPSDSSRASPSKGVVQLTSRSREPQGR